MKVLVLRFSSIGDILLTTPVIRCLAKQLPNAEIHVATKAAFAPLLSDNPYIHQLHLLTKDDGAIIQQFKEHKFDFVVDLHHNLRTLRIKWALGVKSGSFPKLNLEKWRYVQTKNAQIMPSVHIVDRYFEAASSLGIQNDQAGLDFFITEDLAHSLPNEYLAVCLGGSYATKRLPVSKLIELIPQFKMPVVLLGGKSDWVEAQQVFEMLNSTVPMTNLVGQLSVQGTGLAIQGAKLVMTHDTGMMHMAAAFKRPTVAIWGNTTPELGMSPYLTPHVNWQVAGLSCRPCSKLGFQACPKGHFNCMNLQTFGPLPQY